MAHSLLTEKGKNDLDMQALPEDKRHTLLALARKLERQGCNVRFTDRDALFHDGVDYIAPAATSNVITRNNVSSIIARKVIAIGNHVTHDDAQQAVAELGFDFEHGELVNAGGVVISIQEVMRDLRRIAAKNGAPTRELGAGDYVDLLRKTQVDYTRKVYKVAEHMGIDRGAAIKVVSLGNMATNRGMRIDQSVRDLLVAA
jgi:glutamate dehydrogenase/leucine dehydrogenase